MGMAYDYESHKYRQAKAWLVGLARLRDEVATLKAVADSQRELALTVSGLDYEARAAGSANDDAIPNAIARFQQAAAEYASRAADLASEQQAALEMLHGMDDPRHYRCLALRYLCGWDWPRIEGEMGYTHDGMKSLHRRAVIAAWDVMPHWLRDPSSNAIPDADFSNYTQKNR